MDNKMDNKIDINDYPIALDVRHVQEILGISKGKAYEIVNSGMFRVIRIGSRIKIPRNSFFEWFEGKQIINE